MNIENLHIDDSNHPDVYRGPAIFSNFNPQNTNDSYVEKYPYVKTREVVLDNVSIESGMELRISDNLYMFKGLKTIKTRYR